MKNSVKSYEIPNSGAMHVKAPKQITTPKTGSVKTSDKDLRCGK